MEITFIRHSTTLGNLKKRYIGITDQPLCNEGIELIQNHMKDSSFYPTIEALYSSPLLRCLETGTLIYPNHSPKIYDNLKECNFGDFENKNYMELENNVNYKNWIESNGLLPFPNGESKSTFQKRSIIGFHEVLEDAFINDYHNIALIVHGGTIMSLMEEYAYPKKSFYEWHADNGKGYTILIDKNHWLQGNCSFSLLRTL